jgi:predicted esterase
VTRPGERVSVVLLHGYDSRPGSWLAFARALGARCPDVDIQLLSGPVVLGSGDSAPSSLAWFDAGHDSFPTVHEAAALVRSKLEGPSVLVGFSQGGAVALTVAFGEACVAVRAVVGVVAIGAFLPEGVLPKAFDGPLVVVHGEADAVVDVMFGERMHRQATAAGVPSSIQLHAGGHEVPISATVDLVAGVVAQSF